VWMVAPAMVNFKHANHAGSKWHARVYRDRRQAVWLIHQRF
jgi:hypothetical protein